MICFCRPASSAKPISTPRSPRATITPSLARTTSARFVTASARSIFATNSAWPPAFFCNSRASSMSLPSRGKEMPR